MACPVTRYPKKQPSKWKPPVPRWQLELPVEVTHVYTLYVGVQSHQASVSPAFSKAVLSVIQWLDDLKQPDLDISPAVVDNFVNETGHDLEGSRVWVCYWTDQALFQRATNQLDLVTLYNNLREDKATVGIWTESISVPIARLETNYAGLHESPGVSRLPGAKREEHTLTAYWGAARDRMPDSEVDLFEMPGTDKPKVEDVEEKKHITDYLANKTDDPALQPPEQVPEGLGQCVVGQSYDNMCHIRSGQCWNQCPEDEASTYENGLQKTLMRGMDHLWANPVETGTLGLRWLRNIDSEGKPINETCGAGFFRNLRDLEVWSSTHPTHMAIFTGAHKHAREWGPNRKFMTWHEVSVLKEGEGRWEYVNCSPRTGVMRFVKMDKIEKL